MSCYEIAVFIVRCWKWPGVGNFKLGCAWLRPVFELGLKAGTVFNLFPVIRGPFVNQEVMFTLFCALLL